jgi:hypothetical protein
MSPASLSTCFESGIRAHEFVVSSPAFFQLTPTGTTPHKFSSRKKKSDFLPAGP